LVAEQILKVEKRRKEERRLTSLIEKRRKKHIKLNFYEKEREKLGMKR
jgi:hypothetical protein